MSGQWDGRQISMRFLLRNCRCRTEDIRAFSHTVLFDRQSIVKLCLLGCPMSMDGKLPRCILSLCKLSE